MSRNLTLYFLTSEKKYKSTSNELSYHSPVHMSPAPPWLMISRGGGMLVVMLDRLFNRHQVYRKRRWTVGSKFRSVQLTRCSVDNDTPGANVGCYIEEIISMVWEPQSSAVCTDVGVIAVTKKSTVPPIQWRFIWYSSSGECLHLSYIFMLQTSKEKVKIEKIYISWPETVGCGNVALATLRAWIIKK